MHPWRLANLRNDEHLAPSDHGGYESRVVHCIIGHDSSGTLVAKKHHLMLPKEFFLVENPIALAEGGVGEDAAP